MRINHKYLRNKHYKTKNWKRARNRLHPFETINPYGWKGQILPEWSVEEQIKRNFDVIEKDARGFENGFKHPMTYKNAPSWFRRMINKQDKAKERNALHKINNGEYDLEVPAIKKDAGYDYW